MAKRREYEISLEPSGRMLADGHAPLEVASAWTPEHLALAALARCTLSSLEHQTERREMRMSGSASAAGAVARREEDGRYAFVEITCRLDVQLDPVPKDGELRKLLHLAERGCFIGSSLTASPRYEWHVNGQQASSS